MLPPPTPSPGAQSLQVVQMLVSPAVNSGLRPGWPISHVGLSLWGFPRQSPLKQGPPWANCLRCWPPTPDGSWGVGPSNQILWGWNCLIYGAKARGSHCAWVQAPVTANIYINNITCLRVSPQPSQKLRDSVGHDLLVSLPQLWVLLWPPPSP